MTHYKIAHIRDHGVNMIIIPLDPSFGKKTWGVQNKIMDEIQISAKNAGLTGTVVPVWQIGENHGFIAPPKWHPFFKTFSWDDILARINKELLCGVVLNGK
jgi:hypothetical protein